MLPSSLFDFRFIQSSVSRFSACTFFCHFPSLTETSTLWPIQGSQALIGLPNTWRAMQTPIIGTRWPLRTHKHKLIKRGHYSADTLDYTDMWESNREPISLLTEQTDINQRVKWNYKITCIMYLHEQRNHMHISLTGIDAGTQPVNSLCIHLNSLHAIIHLNAKRVYKCEGSPAISACHYLPWWPLFLCIDQAAGWASRTDNVFKIFFFFNVEKKTKTYHDENDGSDISILKLILW